MIRALRRRHRVVVPLLGAVVALVALVALAGRRPAPPAVERLPAGTEPRLAEVALPALDTTAPVAVYWSARADTATLDDGARLLGILRPTGEDRYPVPADLATAGFLTLWDLERHRVVDVVELGAGDTVALTYRAVQWNRQKRLYDLTIVAGVVVYLATFLGLGAALRPNATAETLALRALGTLALLLLHVVLCIGPLCRLDRRFLPLLFNRRHLGVTTFLVGAAHAGLATVQFHALGEWNPLVSLLAGNPNYAELSRFPFQTLGLGALGILFLMAVTSHDFWLANLTAPAWKALHMGVYLAYGLLILHVALGVLQAETNPLLVALLGAGFVTVTGLHVVAGWRERGGDRLAPVAADGFVRVARVDEIPPDRARIVCAAGERIAVFRHDGTVSALSNVCQHQNGPLGEGKVIDGCVTCPWHGYQYRPESGASPPPFTERVPVFRVQVRDGEVWVDPTPLPGGTVVAPAVVDEVTR